MTWASRQDQKELADTKAKLEWLLRNLLTDSQLDVKHPDWGYVRFWGGSLDNRPARVLGS